VNSGTVILLEFQGYCLSRWIFHRSASMPTQSSRQITPEHCATDLMDTIHPIMQFIRTEMRNQREPSLSVPQFRLLGFLGRHPGASLSEVAEHLGITRATASSMTDRLVKRGLVDRAEDPQERRQVMLKLTPSGQKELDQMRTMTRLKITELLGGLTPEELVSISSGLKVLERVFKQSDHPG
jgi:DNA-binding MarR family transcriptional regulator